MKNFLLYFAIFILLILLFLPWGLRTFASDLYKQEEKKSDVIESISCNKLNETMNISYLNGNTYNITYTIAGNYEFDIKENENNDGSLKPTKDLHEIAAIDYNQVADVTTFKVNLSRGNVNLDSISQYTKNINEEIDIMAQNGFLCTKSNIS